MSKISNVAYNKRLNQIAPIAYSINYENSHQLVHKVAKGSFQTWADSDVQFLTIGQVNRLVTCEDFWDEPTDETLSMLGLEKIIVHK